MSNMNLRNISTETQLEAIKDEHPNLDIKQLLAIYPEEQANKIINNKDKLKKLMKNFDKISGVISVNSLVMTCHTECPYSNICMFRKNELDPIGSPCPVEKKLIMDMEFDIVTSLDIDRSDPIEMEMLWDLIDTKLLDMRASAKLKDGSIIQVVERSVGKSLSTSEDIAPAITLKIDLKKLKHGIIDSFVATRRAKKRYGMQAEASTIQDLIMEAAKKVNINAE